MKEIALKAIHVMPALILQKPSITSKSKDHLKAVETRLHLSNEGNIRELLREGETIQERLHTVNQKADISKTSLKFRKLMLIGNVNGALKLMTDNM